MAMHQLDSLAAIEAGVAAAHPDVLLLGLHRLADAPAAFALLSAHEKAAEGCWRTVNLAQVMGFSTLASLLEKASRRMVNLAAAIQEMDASSEEVEEAGVQFWNSFPRIHSGPTGSIGNYCINFNRVRHHAMRRLDRAYHEINGLLQGELALAQATPYPSEAQDLAIQRTERALIALRKSNRRVVRRLNRLQRVALKLRGDLPFQDNASHALSRLDHEVQLTARRFAAAVGQLVGRLQGGELDPINTINHLQQEIDQQLGAALILNHERFSAPVLNVISLDDLGEVLRISTPHQGLPARQFQIHLRALSVLSDGDEMALKIAAGIDERGWVVRGMGALARARQIDAHLVELKALLKRLNTRNVIGFLGAILDPQPIAEIDTLVQDITEVIFAEAGVPEMGVVCMNVIGLLDEARKVSSLARSKDLDLRDHVNKVMDIIDITRSEAIAFK